jgi:hypothetical protein
VVAPRDSRPRRIHSEGDANFRSRSESRISSLIRAPTPWRPSGPPASGKLSGDLTVSVGCKSTTQQQHTKRRSTEVALPWGMLATFGAWGHLRLKSAMRTKAGVRRPLVYGFTPWQRLPKIDRLLRLANGAFGWLFVPSPAFFARSNIDQTIEC